MSKLGIWLRGLGLAWLIVAGCKSTQPDLKPPKQPETLNVPPDSEARFTDPMEYPKGTPRAAQVKRGNAMSPLSDPTRFTSGAGRSGAY